MGEQQRARSFHDETCATEGSKERNDYASVFCGHSCAGALGIFCCRLVMFNLCVCSTDVVFKTLGRACEFSPICLSSKEEGNRSITSRRLEFIKTSSDL